MKATTPIASSLACLYLLIAAPTQAQTTPDPGIDGSHTVLKLDYDLGDAAFTYPEFSAIEVRGSVHYPSDLSSGPFPVLVFLHGRHSTCYETANPSNTSLSWPCPTGEQSITSFEGYDYLAQHMASHGYIVISVSANGINAVDNSSSDNGMAARGGLMQHHLDLWQGWNTVSSPPFDSTFIGKLDLTRVGTMGHSRGGEGVVKHALLNTSLGNPYGIKAVLTLAPVDFTRSVLTETPLMNVAPYCDGDVSNLQGVHYYDDARYLVTGDESPKHSILMLGANHNFYNTVWTPGSYIAGTSDDWDDVYGSSVDFCGSASSGSKRLNPTRQQSALKAYLSAFFRTYVGTDTTFKPILNVEDIIPPASTTLDSSEVFVSYHAPASKRLDINRIETEGSETTNTLTGVVTQNGLTKYDVCADDSSEPDCGINSFFADKEPHSGTSSVLGMPQLGLRWDDNGDWYENAIPTSSQDFSSFGYLQFRTGINFTESTSGSDIHFTVQLTDVSNALSILPIGNYTNALYFPPGNHILQLPKMCFNTIKIPLTDFTGVDLSQISKVTFLFDSTTAGSIFIADLCVSGNALPVVTNVNQSTGFENVTIYPNPTENFVYINLGDGYNTVRNIQVFDTKGSIVENVSTNGNQVVTLNTSRMDNGVYIIELQNQRGKAHYKLIKK